LDSCASNHKHRPGFPRFHQLDIPFLHRLRAAGVQPEEVDAVLCTHLHSDHVGWNTMLVDGRWVPTFPNAKYLFSRIENEIGDPHRNPAAEADIQRGFAYCDSVLPVIEAGQAVLVDGEHAIDDSLTIVPAPGHTRGHVALWLANTSGRALFSGDVMHHALQNPCTALEFEILRTSGRCAGNAPAVDRAVRGAPRHPVSGAFRRAACDAHSRRAARLLPRVRRS
jgi:glyoxylase-like metal-dependent hydrolase (beta-lactamase superfamily II)